MSGAWGERQTEDGSWTLVHPGHGEACHSRSGAWTESLERYARACRLDAAASGPEPLRLLDVGTGLGLNLAAALALLDGARPLEVLALEADPGVIAQGLALYRRVEGAGSTAPPWEPWHGHVRTALEAALERPGEAVALAGGGTLLLRLGDARRTLGSAGGPEAFDAVFLDAFSPSTEPDLWAEPFLRAIAARMAPRGVLSTYSAAFAVRLALSRAGLRVGAGPAVGAKREGTLASPALALPDLPPRVARRLAARATPPGPGHSEAPARAPGGLLD